MAAYLLAKQSASYEDNVNTGEELAIGIGTDAAGDQIHQEHEIMGSRARARTWSD